MLALTAGIAACARDPASDDTGAGASDTGGSGTETTGAPASIPAPTDACEEAPLVPQGRWQGTLRGRTPAAGIAGICGDGGPDVFLRVAAPVRADLRVEVLADGFVPRVSLAPDDCLGGREIACAAGEPLVLPDLAAGTVVRLSVGADPAVFSDLNEETVEDGAVDPLDFAVDVALTRVLGVGEVCEPALRGRCAAGTMCLPDAGGRTEVCTALPADTCASAEVVAVALVDGAGAVEIDPSAPQTDAHAHRCGGQGTRERVLRLDLPATPPQRGLSIRATRPDVALALRAPGCLAGDEVDCAAPLQSGARVVLASLDALRHAGAAPYLFVELPAGSEADPPFSLELLLVASPAPWGE